MGMKNKLFITILFLLIGNSLFAQIDTLNVYLEKNQENRTGVDLIFENNSNDTILLFTLFHNFSMGGEIPHYSGINIQYFYNDKYFNFNWGEMPPLMFVFPERFTLIYPKSKVKLFFDVGYYPFPQKTDGKFEVSFFMNYVFSKLGSSDIPKRIRYFQTNRVTMVESETEEE
jgi:hypothetical protein